MSLGERIKSVRKSLLEKTTQQTFGEQLGVTREMITSYEIGKVIPSDAFLKLVSALYGISYPWLKDGIGPMYLPPDTEDELVDKVMVGSNEFAKDIMRAFSKLGDDEWQLLKKIVDSIKKADR